MARAVNPCPSGSMKRMLSHSCAHSAIMHRSCPAPQKSKVNSSSGCLLCCSLVGGAPLCTWPKLRNVASPSSGYPRGVHLIYRSRRMHAPARGGGELSGTWRQGVVCSALAPAATEGNEYDHDSPKMKKLVTFLEQDLIHLFDEQGIDKSMYDDQVEFRDPISKYSSLAGYLFNIQMLRAFLTPKFELHSAKQTGPRDITTRWTMTMYVLLLPWRPELVFTGTSVMTVNQETGKFSKHVDYWDSIQNNEYFSFEAVGDLLKQLGIYRTPNLETPRYKVLKRTSKYEVRQYEQFLVAETAVNEMTGSNGFKTVAGYLFGKNSRSEKMKMTTPVFNQKVKNACQLQFVLPLQIQSSSAPFPLSDEVSVRTIEKAYAAVTKFNGEARQRTVEEKERVLRAGLSNDGLQADEGLLLARYNDPGSTWPFMRRNELIIWLNEFSLEAA